MENNINRIKELMGINEQLVPIDEKTVNRIMDTHGKNGYIIISAYRNERSPAENRSKHLELMSDIKNFGFSFIKVFGGFIEDKGLDTEKVVQEPSLLVPNFPLGSVQPNENTDKIFQMGVELCKKYEQDSFLFKDKSNPPKYIDKNGGVDMEFDGNFIINKPEQYFTSINKNNNGKFTFTEMYLVKPPNTMNERVKRLKKDGEDFINVK